MSRVGIAPRVFMNQHAQGARVASRTRRIASRRVHGLATYCEPAFRVHYGCVLPGILIIANEAIPCELRPWQPERAAARFHPAKMYDVMRMCALFRK